MVIGPEPNTNSELYVVNGGDSDMLFVNVYGCSTLL